jgi:hypothetical protein
MKGRALVLALLLPGCGRTVTGEDCVKIRENMREAWGAELKKAADQGPGAEKAQAVIKAEGERLAADWMSECKTELMGKRVDAKEMDCLLRARTVGDIKKCKEP